MPGPVSPSGFQVFGVWGTLWGSRPFLWGSLWGGGHKKRPRRARGLVEWHRLKWYVVWQLIRIVVVFRLVDGLGGVARAACFEGYHHPCICQNVRIAPAMVTLGSACRPSPGTSHPLARHCATIA